MIGKFEETFLKYRQAVETERCVWSGPDGARADVAAVKDAYEQALSQADKAGRAQLGELWDSFWGLVADEARAGRMSLFSIKQSEYIAEAPYEVFAGELALLGDVHPRLAQVIAEGYRLAEDLTREGVGFWMAEYLKAEIKPGIWEMARGPEAGKPVKGTCYDWFPLRPEMNSRLAFVLGNMCLHRREDANAAGATDAGVGVLIYLTRALPMDDIQLEEFRRYAQRRWNAMAQCPYCGTKLVGLFTRTCINCNRDVKKMKVR